GCDLRLLPPNLFLFVGHGADELDAFLEALSCHLGDCRSQVADSRTTATAGSDAPFTAIKLGDCVAYSGLRVGEWVFRRSGSSVGVANLLGKSVQHGTEFDVLAHLGYVERFR